MYIFTISPKITQLPILTNKLLDDTRFGSAYLKKGRAYRQPLLLIGAKLCVSKSISSIVLECYTSKQNKRSLVIMFF